MKNNLIIVCLISLLVIAGCEKTDENRVTVPREMPMPSVSPMPKEVPEDKLLATCETEILDGEENRIHNISLAIGELDGYVVSPGETFSFNDVVGERTKERGYREASVIIHNEKKRDFGGGVCQVSSTLFQAVREADLTVLERHDHQKDVGYAHQGDDAAVDYGSKDFCFRNQTEYPIQIFMSVGDGIVRAEIKQPA